MEVTSPIDMSSQSPYMQRNLGHPDARGLAMNYAMMNHPNMAAIPVPAHRPPAGSPLLHYSGAMPWPKLVPHY